MPKATGPASIKSLERLHRNAVRALNQELERISKAKEPVPAALLNAATAMLKVTGVVEPKRVRAKVDRLASLLVDYDESEDDTDPEETIKRALESAARAEATAARCATEGDTKGEATWTSRAAAHRDRVAKLRGADPSTDFTAQRELREDQ